VLEWLAKAVKPILILVAFVGAIYAAVEHKITH